jgi:hypothetical protein
VGVSNTAGSLEQAKTLKKQLFDLRERTLQTRAERYEQLSTLLGLIAESEATLRELDEHIATTTIAAITAHEAGHRFFSQNVRSALIRIDRSASDFAFSVIGSHDGGASTQVLQQIANEMKADFTVGSLYAALHRLVRVGWIVKADRKKGAAYQLTSIGAHEWSEQIRRSRLAK